MKTPHLFIVPLLFLAAACGNKQDSMRPSSETHDSVRILTKNTLWREYRDSVYPAIFNHPIIPLQNDTYYASRVSTNQLHSNDEYEIDVFVNLSEEFPDYPDEEDEPDGWHPLQNESLITIVFYPANSKIFIWRLSHPGKAEIQEASLNSIPMLRLIDPKTNDISLHIPLIPGYYITIKNAAYSADKSHQPSYQRIKELAGGVLKSLRWERPIDVNTREFKDWKKRILWFVDRGINMPELLDTERLRNLPEDELEKDKDYQKNEQKREAYVQAVFKEAKKRWPEPNMSKSETIR